MALKWGVLIFIYLVVYSLLLANVQILILYAKIRIIYFHSHMANQISWRQLTAKAKERGHMATLSHLFHGTLASGSAWNQMRILRTPKPLALPVPSPVCAEWLPPTQVNRYFGPKLSFAPDFCNSVYSLPNRNNGKLTLVDGPHEGTMAAQERSPGFISKQGHREKGQMLPFHGVILGCTAQLPAFTHSSWQQHTRPQQQGRLLETCKLMAYLTHLPLIQQIRFQHTLGARLWAQLCIL